MKTPRDDPAAVSPERKPSGSPVSVAHGSALVFASSIVGSAGFFVAALMVARSLGPAGRGSVAFITVTALVTARVAKIGLGQATSVLAAQRPGARPMLLSNLLAFSLVTSLVASVVVVGVLYVAGAEPAGLDRAHLAILMAGIAVAGLVDDNFLIGCGRLRESAAISAVGGWLYPSALAVVIVAAELSVATAALAWIGAHLVWAALLAGVGLRVAGAGFPSAALLRESVRFGARAWPGSVSLFLNARLDQILVGVIASDVALGLYAVAVNGAEILMFLPTAIATSLLPAIAREQGLERVDRTLRSFRAATLLTLCSMAGAAAVGWAAIPAAFGSDFGASVAPFMWLLPGALGYTALSIFSNSLLAAHLPGASSAGSAAALGAGLALDLALIPVFGASGAAAAASAAFIAGGATVAVLYRRATGFGWAEAIPSAADVAFLRLVSARAVRRRREAA